MQSPSVKVLEYGVFDSNIKFPRMSQTGLRTVPCFELELYTSDQPSETCIDGVWYSVEKGSLVCAKPGQRRCSKLSFQCRYIHFSTEDATLCALLQALPDHLRVWPMEPVLEIFQEMLTAESDSMEDVLLLGACLYRLIRLVSRYKRMPQRESGGVFAHCKALMEVEDYIQKNLSEELSLAHLAARCNLSSVYFHTLFTAFFHKTPAQYILDCRMAAARTGLLTSDYPLSELAADCGFSSQSYFSYKFKQVTGKTPMQYRREMRGRMKL